MLIKSSIIINTIYYYNIILICTTSINYLRVTANFSAGVMAFRIFVSIFISLWPTNVVSNSSKADTDIRK